ncbi:unnamed protein product [Clavelina lepadiformis]|uniref:P/Homo B domain-containing protein n=1 Tax=Clavelina lepadiformis TaxID=159417 RepID=A0ABP0G486_CLALP
MFKLSFAICIKLLFTFSCLPTFVFWILWYTQNVSSLETRKLWTTSDNVILTNTLSIKLVMLGGETSGDLHVKANQIAYSLGMTNLGQVGELAGHFLFSLNNKTVKVTNEVVAFAHSNVEWYYQQELLTRVKRYPIPAKTYTIGNLQKPLFRDPLFSQQWHLHNKPGKLDCNVTGVWANNITGIGIVIAVVDDGVQWRHPDLVENYCADGSFDLNSDDNDPSPEPDKNDENKHGTRCAGEIAAATNSVCGVGVAYRAKFSGIRILDGPMTDSMEATAFNKHFHINDIYSCSWGPEDDGKTVDGPRPLAQAALKHGVVAGRRGLGSIFLVASGNGGNKGDNCNYDGYANSIYTVTIAAVDEFGKRPPYAEQCTSMFVSTLSSGEYPARNIVTTDWTLGKKNTQCTTGHSGTSAATPLVAGMVALMLQVQPCLGWRDIQHLFALTAIPLYEYPASNQKKSLWHTNTAKYTHNTYHGFGFLNSWRLVNAAKIWKSVPWLTSLKPICSGTNIPIPDKTAGKLIVKTEVTENDCRKHLLLSLEHILITVTLSHPNRGQLQFSFICPTGTHSVIPVRKSDTSDAGLSSWTFSTVRCWGENPVGRYQLIIEDHSRNTEEHSLKRVLQSWKITLYGSQMDLKELSERRLLMSSALNGEYIPSNSNISINCARDLDSYDITEALSDRTLKLVALLSCFFVFWGAYYSVEMALCNSNGNGGSASPKFQGDRSEECASTLNMQSLTFMEPNDHENTSNQKNT